MTSTATTEQKKIVTHNGTFHCGEALACYMLQTHVPEFRNCPITRTRDESVINGPDVAAVVDVGGVYDHSARRYDHHQHGFSDTFDGSNCTTISSVGLVYKHFGRTIIQYIEPVKEEAKLGAVFEHLYEMFIEALDAIDNGMRQYDVSPVHRTYGNKTDLSWRVSRLNPKWNESCSNEDIDERFHTAVRLAGAEFEDCEHRTVSSFMLARLYIKIMDKQHVNEYTSGLTPVVSESLSKDKPGAVPTSKEDENEKLDDVPSLLGRTEDDLKKRYLRIFKPLLEIFDDKEPFGIF